MFSTVYGCKSSQVWEKTQLLQSKCIIFLISLFSMLDTQEVLNNLTTLNFYCVRADQSGLKKVLDKEKLQKQHLIFNLLSVMPTFHNQNIR